MLKMRIKKNDNELTPVNQCKNCKTP